MAGNSRRRARFISILPAFQEDRFMTSRRIVVLLLLSAAPALAQPQEDKENLPPVQPDPSAVVQRAIPASVVNAGQATVSPAEGRVPQHAEKSVCDASNPCATPTPESR
jgi:hypothetical protein